MSFYSTPGIDAIIDPGTTQRREIPLVQWIQYGSAVGIAFPKPTVALTEHNIGWFSIVERGGIPFWIQYDLGSIAGNILL
jgi:hypothetical protein